MRLSSPFLHPKRPLDSRCRLREASETSCVAAARERRARSSVVGCVLPRAGGASPEDSRTTERPPSGMLTSALLQMPRSAAAAAAALASVLLLASLACPPRARASPRPPALSRVSVAPEDALQPQTFQVRWRARRGRCSLTRRFEGRHGLEDFRSPVESCRRPVESCRRPVESCRRPVESCRRPLDHQLPWFRHAFFASLGLARWTMTSRSSERNRPHAIWHTRRSRHRAILQPLPR